MLDRTSVVSGGTRSGVLLMLKMTVCSGPCVLHSHLELIGHRRLAKLAFLRKPSSLHSASTHCRCWACGAGQRGETPQSLLPREGQLSCGPVGGGAHRGCRSDVRRQSCRRPPPGCTGHLSRADTESANLLGLNDARPWAERSHTPPSLFPTVTQ